jgi:hypothetical protein
VKNSVSFPSPSQSGFRGSAIDVNVTRQKTNTHSFATPLLSGPKVNFCSQVNCFLVFSGEGETKGGRYGAGIRGDIRNLFLSHTSLHDLVLLQVSWKH